MRTLKRPSAWLFRADRPKSETEQPPWKPIVAALADCLAFLTIVGVCAWLVLHSDGNPAAWGALCLAGFATLVSWVTFGVALGGVRTLLPLYQATAATQNAQRQLDIATRAVQTAEHRLRDVEVAMSAEGAALRASTGALTEGARAVEEIRDQLILAAHVSAPLRVVRADPPPQDQVAGDRCGGTDLEALERAYQEGDIP